MNSMIHFQRMNSHLKNASIILFVFIISFAVRLEIIRQPLDQHNQGFDLQLYCYEGEQVASGINPYNKNDQPETRVEQLDGYRSSNPPLNFLLFGGVNKISVVISKVLHHHIDSCTIFAYTFALTDALVGAFMLISLVYIFRLPILISSGVSVLWYSLNTAPVVWNVFFSEDKSIYSILIIILVSLIYRMLETIKKSKNINYNNLYVKNSSVVDSFVF